MYTFKVFLFYLSLTTSLTVGAAIYKANRSFEHSDEILYSNWVKDKVTPDIFSNPESPYYGIKVDCADAAFALRMIYAYENKLSFEFIENEGKTITERTPRFDHVSINELEKIKALINFVGENIGSEVLASDNTYPIELTAIRPGDLYITRWTNAKAELTRHVYIIKDILPTGDLILYSATQPRAVRPLITRKGMPLKIFKESPFGFKRFKGNLDAPIEQLEHFSLSQYDVLKHGEDKFFKMVKSGLKKTEDTLQLNIERRIENICVALTIRQDVIEKALEEKANISTKCFSKKQYDEFSTPSRDKNIIQDIERLRNGYKTIKNTAQSSELNDKTTTGLNYLTGEDDSQEALSKMRELCSISLELAGEKQIIMTMKSFYDRYKAGLISSNPNEAMESRWGLKKANSRCPDL